MEQCMEGFTEMANVSPKMDTQVSNTVFFLLCGILELCAQAK